MQTTELEPLPEEALTPFTMTRQDMENCKEKVTGLTFSEEESEQFLRALWGSMCGLVELGYGVSAIQAILGINEELSNSEEDHTV